MESQRVQPQEGGEGVGHHEHGEEGGHDLLELHLAAPEDRVGEDSDDIDHHQLAADVYLNHTISYPPIIVTGVVCSVVAQLGDLSFSLIKREFGIKDYGHIFLEHGGVLDRFDSVIFVAPVLAALLQVLKLG